MKAAPLFAWAMYATVFPVNLRRRIGTLVRMMRRDLAGMARDPLVDEHHAAWRARLYHRTLRLVRMTERSGRAREEAIERGLETLKAGIAIQRLHRRLADTGPSESDRRAFRVALRRAERMDADAAAALNTPRKVEARPAFSA